MIEKIKNKNKKKMLSLETVGTSFEDSRPENRSRADGQGPPGAPQVGTSAGASAVSATKTTKTPILPPDKNFSFEKNSEKNVVDEDGETMSSHINEEPDMATVLRNFQAPVGRFALAKEQLRYERNDAPDDLIKIVSEHNSLVKADDRLIIPMHELLKKFDAPTIVDSMYEKFSMEKQALKETFSMVEENLEELENYAWGNTKKIREDLAKFYDDNKEALSIYRCVDYAMPFYSGNHIIMSPFDQDITESPRFQEVRSRFIKFVENLDFKIEDTTFKVKFEKKIVPYSLFSLKVDIYKAPAIKRIFQGYLTAVDEIIAHHIPSGRAVHKMEMSNDNFVLAYFVVKLGSDVAPPPTKAGLTFSGTSTRALSNLPHCSFCHSLTHVRKNCLLAGKCWYCGKHGHMRSQCASYKEAKLRAQAIKEKEQSKNKSDTEEEDDFLPASAHNNARKFYKQQQTSESQAPSQGNNMPILPKNVIKAKRALVEYSKSSDPEPSSKRTHNEMEDDSTPEESNASSGSNKFNHSADTERFKALFDENESGNPTQEDSPFFVCTCEQCMGSFRADQMRGEVCETCSQVSHSQSEEDTQIDEELH